MIKIVNRYLFFLLALSLTPLELILAQTSPSLNFSEFNIPFGDLGEPTATMLVTPDNQNLFFRVFESPSRAAIYRTLVSDPSEVERVSVASNANSLIGADFRFVMNSSGSHVLYTVQAGAQNQAQLYSYNITTRQNIRLSSIDNTTRPRFELNKAGDHVVFIEQDLNTNTGRLLTAPIDGSALARELATTDIGQTFGTSFLDGDLFIANDSQRVLYYVESGDGDLRDLYSVNLEGSPIPLKLNSIASIEGEEVERLQLFSNDTRVAYRATGTNTPSNLFSVPVDGSSEPRQVSEEQTTLFGVRAQNWFIDSQEQRIIYTVGSTSNAKLLSSSLALPLNHIRLDSDANPVSNFGLLKQILQTNDVAYVSENPPDSDLFDLYTIDSSGGTAQKINSDSTEISNTYFGNGSTFLYTRQQRNTADDRQFQLVKYDAMTGQSEVLSSTRPYPTLFSSQFILSPNENFIYLLSNLGAQNQFDMLQISLTGDNRVTKVNRNIANNSSIDLNTIVVNDSLIVYRVLSPDGDNTQYFANRDNGNSSFFVLKAVNGNTIVISL